MVEKGRGDRIQELLLREFFRGFIRIHILHHAGERPVWGAWLMEELARHGYRVSPGTLYPLLHEMERRGWVASKKRTVRGKMRRCYTLTPEGERVLSMVKAQLRELVREVLPEETPPPNKEVHDETPRGRTAAPSGDRPPRVHQEGDG